MIPKLMSLFQAHLKARHKTDWGEPLTLYPYQLDVAEKIFEALVQNMRLTSSASQEDIKKLKLTEIPIEFSRQSGKTTGIVHIIEFIMVFFPRAFGKPVTIGIFAPQREQAKTDFDRLKTSLSRTSELTVLSAPADDVDKARQESNAKTIVLPNKSSCYIFPVTPTSKPESKTLDLIIFEESQDMNDRIVKEQIWPMGASTNAPRVYIGTAGTQICHFYRLGQEGTSLKLYYPQIIVQRRALYEATGDARHLIYEQAVGQEIERFGIDSDEIARPYFGKWLIGTGQFTTQDDLEALINPRRVRRTFHDKQNDCYVGIDTAKHPDSTVVTVVRYNAELKHKELINWLELRGENYKDQFDIIFEFMKKYKVVAVAIDATGSSGDFMPDMFARETEFSDEKSGLYAVKFSAVSKDNMYKNLKVTISESLTDLPQLDTREAERFKQQTLDLQQEYVGQLLRVNHPDDANAHDDYPDSWALAEWAYARYNEDNELQLIVIGEQKERKIEKSESGEIIDYWPGVF